MTACGAAPHLLVVALDMMTAFLVYFAPLVLAALIVVGLVVLDQILGINRRKTGRLRADAQPIWQREDSPALMGAPTGPTAAGVMAVVMDGRVMADKDEMAWLCQQLRESDIFEGLTDHELRMVASIGQRRRVVAGERLAHAGSRGDNFYLILQGDLRLVTHYGEGELPVRSASAGDTLPLAALLEPPVLVTSVEATVDGEVFTIPRMRLLELCDLQPMIGLQVYRAAAKVFEGRYRETLDGLTTALRSALQVALAGAGVAQ